MKWKHIKNIIKSNYIYLNLIYCTKRNLLNKTKNLSNKTN